MKKINKIYTLSLLTMTCLNVNAAPLQENNIADIWFGEYPKVEYFVPRLFAGYWNTGDTHQWSNNCYNYAANRISPTKAKSQPGYASGHRGFDTNRRSCAGVMEGARRDGFTPIPRSQWASKKANTNSVRTLMALVLAPNRDYHWYRRDFSGQWSHKPGSTAVTHLDNSGRVITDPENADRGIYTTFCGYFEGQSSLFLPYKIQFYVTQNRGETFVTGEFEADDPFGPSLANSIEQPKSTVTLLKYSGRENPSVPISQLDDYLKYRLSEVAALQDTSIIRKEVAQPGEPLLPGKLGYSGILIDDVEGVYFNAGDKVLISEDEIKVLSQNHTQSHTRMASSQDQGQGIGFTKSHLLDLSLEQDLIDFIEAK